MIRKVSLVIIALALIALTSFGCLQTACAADTPPSTAAAGHFDVEAATAAYLATMTPAARARSDAYFEGGYWLMLWDFLFGLLLAWALLGWRLSARTRLRRTPDTLSLGADRALRHSVFSTHHGSVSAVGGL